MLTFPLRVGRDQSGPPKHHKLPGHVGLVGMEPLAEIGHSLKPVRRVIFGGFAAP